MPVLDSEDLKRFIIPAKQPGRLRVALSHEFVELYRGDKDLRIGKILAEKYGCEIVHLGSSVASPADSRVFKTKQYPVKHVGQLPEDYYLLLLKSKLIFHRRGNISLGGFFRWAPSLLKYTIRWKPDLVFENPYMTLTPRSFMTFAASRVLQIPVVYIDCGDIFYKWALKNKIVYPFERAVVRRSAAVITYNEAGKQRFIRKYGYPEDKIYVIPKPIDTKRFSPEVDSRDFRRKYELGRKFVVAYFGRLCANKGARALLDAAEIIRARGADKNIVFLFVGGNLETDQAAEFSAHLKSLNLSNVKLTGWYPNEEMPRAYAGVDVAVFPDLVHPPAFPTVLAESMAAGLPIVIGIKGWESAVPLTDRETAMIIEPSNPVQLADSIQKLKKDARLRKKLSRNVLRFAREQMDYEVITRKYFEIFQKTVNGKITQRPDTRIDSKESRHKELTVR